MTLGSLLSLQLSRPFLHGDRRAVAAPSGASYTGVQSGERQRKHLHVAALSSSRNIFPRGPSSYISLARTGSHAHTQPITAKGTDRHGGCGAMVSVWVSVPRPRAKPGLLTKRTGDHCYRKDQHNFCYMRLPLEHLLVENSLNHFILAIFSFTLTSWFI